MFRKFIASTALASLAFAVPQAASADAKDAVIGAAVGALLNNAYRNEQAKRQQQQKRVVRTAPATLNSTYTRSERRQIQASLNALGFPVGAVDGVLGRNSRNAIGQFQASRGEAATGQLTRTQFVALTTPSLAQQPMMANRPLNVQEVALLQQSLMRLGFYRGAIDGLDGPGTQQASMNYLATQGRTPANTSRVLATAMAAQAAGFQVPPYLMQEAQASMATASFGAQPQQPFGTQQAFGAQPQQQPFGAQPQQAFGAQPQQQFGAQPQQAFGAQPQQQFGAQPQQQFGAQPQQPQQTFGTQPQQPAGTLASVPQGGQQGLFPAPAGTAPAQQFAPQGQQVIQQPPQGVPQTAQQPLFPGQPQQQPVQQQPQAPAPQQGGQANTLFAAGSGVAPVPAPAQQQSGLDIFSPETGTAQVVQQTDGVVPQAGQAAAFAATE